MKGGVGRCAGGGWDGRRMEGWSDAIQMLRKLNVFCQKKNVTNFVDLSLFLFWVGGLAIPNFIVLEPQKIIRQAVGQRRVRSRILVIVHFPPTPRRHSGPDFRGAGAAGEFLDPLFSIQNAYPLKYLSLNASELLRM